MPSSRGAVLPWAARQQSEVNAWDEALNRRIAPRHPRATWWWGPRSVGNAHTAYCYLCERTIISWAWGGHVTALARRGIELHRSEHVGEVRP